jgi:hypothetical protein
MDHEINELTKEIKEKEQQLKNTEAQLIIEEQNEREQINAIQTVEQELQVEKD